MRFDYTGQRFGFLTVISPTGHTDKWGNAIWHVRCDCGTEVDLPIQTIKKKKNCGCQVKPKYEDLTGQHIGDYTVIGDSGIRNTQGRVLWRIRCSCGTERLISTQGLKGMVRKNCGGPAHWEKDELTGKKYYYLTVLSRIDENHWKCQCSCGNTIVVLGSDLTWGDIRSCGCKAPQKHDLTGQQFGLWAVLKKVGSNPTRYLCRCQCGKERVIPYTNLAYGKTKSCGRHPRLKAEVVSDESESASDPAVTEPLTTGRM